MNLAEQPHCDLRRSGYGHRTAARSRVACLTIGRFIADGPMRGGVERNCGPSMVFRVGGIDIIVIANNGQATDFYTEVYPEIVQIPTSMRGSSPVA
jgi:microcystin degradation protein MlrC